jgi:hypothetical protein
VSESVSTGKGKCSHPVQGNPQAGIFSHQAGRMEESGSGNSLAAEADGGQNLLDPL